MKKLLTRRQLAIAVAVVVMVVLAMAVGATRAYFNDPEQSTENTLRIVTSWFDLAWKYRKPINISNGGSALTDYQLKITIDTNTPIAAGKMQSDGADIRFTQSDGVTEITSYFIESGINTASTIIWVKVPSIPAGSSSIYIYYGNSSATAVSSGDNTFIFFDSFETGLSKWTISGSATQVSTQQTDGTYSMQLQNVVNVYATFTAQTSGVVEYDARPAQTNRAWEMRVEDSTPTIGPRLQFSSTASKIQYYTTKWNNTGLAFSANTWYTFSLDETRVDNDTYDININGTLRVDNAAFNAGLNSVSRIEFYSGATSNTLYVDLVKVRQYASTTPTISGIGAEE